MRKYTVPSVIIGAYAGVAFFVFSAAAAETVLLYPNILRDIPESLQMTQDFMSVIGVGDVMRPLGGLMMVSALIAAAASVRYRTARPWVAASVAAMLSGQFLLSVAYLWPRATILFDDRAKHTIDEIESAADEFVIGQYFRIAAAGLAALFAVIAARKIYRAKILAELSQSTPPAPTASRGRTA
ncbi:hypothetical protein ACWDYH_17895 [Nocardia goodfellowii]